MRLLFDQNLSFRLCRALHASSLGLSTADDLTVWRTAGRGGYLLVSQDADFVEMALLRGPPPKVIWLRCGNRPTAYVAALLREHRSQISTFAEDKNAVCLEIYTS